MDQQGEHGKIDLGDIARGRRITAVTASELAMTPRQVNRPRKAKGLTRVWRKIKFRLEAAKYED